MRSPLGVGTFERIEESGPSRPVTLSSLVACIDDSDGANAFDYWLSRNGAYHQASIMLLHVAQPEWLVRDPMSGVAGHRMMLELEARMNRMTLMLDSHAARLSSTYHGADISIGIESGAPASVIVEIASKVSADRIVLFRHRSSPGFSTLIAELERRLCANCTVEIAAFKQRSALEANLLKKLFDSCCTGDS